MPGRPLSSGPAMTSITRLDVGLVTKVYTSDSVDGRRLVVVVYGGRYLPSLDREYQER